ncbi:alanine dehydrogenase [Asticcacaulis endophyticus]|uniref:Alanine dehydrogenase n=1 Tax=Asticcacaulis endophyticus TaxID=1395890 RepID=A0A918Q2Y5_9CAUL|nr:alanine dehydrogenase [Asticcacaulis endophyticus]GGZ30018.1 alanine dehydrogenase [Asticcacaulis endophyticus]
MKISVPKEIKNHEYRVGLVPDSVAELTHHGHEVYVETLAGAAIGFSDKDYLAAGAIIVATAEEVFAVGDLIVKVKEPQIHECARLHPHQTLFTYLHLAADKPQAQALMASGATCIAYETVTEPQGGLPLLRPMSEVAGRLSVQVGAVYLHKAYGGRGVLLGGVPGVAPGKVVIIGGGVAGLNAAQMAIGLHADVTVLDISAHKLIEIDQTYQGRIKTAYASKAAIAAAVREADLVIGAVLIPGAAAPKLVTRDMVKSMKTGAVMVDIAIDQGGCFDTSRPTSHQDPIYIEDGVVHYCVTNMPGAVARTSALALNNATLPFVLKMVRQGVAGALSTDPHLRAGLNIKGGKITHRAVADALNLDYSGLETLT